MNAFDIVDGSIDKSVHMGNAFGMGMAEFGAIVERGAEQHGLVTTHDARDLGIREQLLRRLAAGGVLVRRSWGIYAVAALEGDPLEQYQEAVLWAGAPTALSHETALDLHQLCGVNPNRVHVTVPLRYRLRRTPPEWLVVHRADLAGRELEWHEGMRIVTAIRAIVDSIGTGVGGNFIDEALEKARRWGRITSDDEHAIRLTRLERDLRAERGTRRGRLQSKDRARQEPQGSRSVDP